MTKKGYMPKLLAMLIGAIMCLCMATVAFTAGGVVGAKAEGETETDPNILQMEEADEFATVGYKIEKQSGSITDANEKEWQYDYIMTVTDSTKSWFMFRDGKIYYNNTNEIVWNITTQNNGKVNGMGGTYNKWHYGIALETSDSTIASFQIEKTARMIFPDTGDRATNPETGENYDDERFKSGEAVITATFISSSKVGNGCGAPGHSEKEICTCGNEPGSGEVLTGKYLRVLYRVVHIEDNAFTFTGAKKDVNGKDGGIWFTFGATDVLGVGSADSEWTRAERDDFIGVNKPFFENIYFLQEFNLENATAAPTAAELAGKDLFSLMTGVNLKENGWLFQTEVRPDHIEIYKQVREYYTDENTFDREGKDVAFEEGDTFYLKAGLKMIGHDANGNWTVASEGGAQNVLSRDQFFTFDGEKWSIDQFSTAISLDKKEAMIEVGANDTITANVEKGKFVSGEASTPVWSSDNEAVATVAGGVVTGVAAGTATIKAELADGTYATAEVTVVRNDEIKSITLDKRNITLYTGDENNTYTLVATIEGGSQASQAVTWTSANPAVATVDENGKVTAVAEGSTKVTATAADGKTAEVTVNVLQAEEENPPTPTPGPDDNTDNKGDETKDEGGCGSNVLGTSAIAASVLMLGAAVVLFARKKNAANK